jgi:hypothetical protein
MIWTELVKLAFLGTERTALPVSIRSALAKQGIDLDNASEEMLLEALVHYGYFEKVARIVQPLDQVVAQAPEETGPMCSPRSAKHLHFILTGEYKSALEEFVHYLVLSQKRLPPEALPDLLAKAIKDAKLWQKIEPVIGARGYWLVRQHPEWQIMAMAYAPDRWETAKREERVQMLRNLRKADPDQSIPVLQASWAKEDATTKKKFLEVIGDALLPSDEPFLIACLEDRHKDTRDNARKLLVQLPESTYFKKIIKAANKLIPKSAEALKNLDLDLLAIEVLSKELGIVKPSELKKSPTNALMQLFRLLPPAFWEEQLSIEPVACLRLLEEHPAANKWMNALLEATLLHQNKNWAAAFVQHWLRAGDDTQWQTASGKKLLRLLSNADFNAIIIRYLGNHFYTLEEDHLVTQWLCMGAHRWDDNLTVMIVRNMQDRLSNAHAFFTDAAMHYFRILKVAAYHCNPNLKDTLKTGWFFKSRMSYRWEKEVENFLRILTFRKEMIKALKS